LYVKYCSKEAVVSRADLGMSGVERAEGVARIVEERRRKRRRVGRESMLLAGEEGVRDGGSCIGEGGTVDYIPWFLAARLNLARANCLSPFAQ